MISLTTNPKKRGEWAELQFLARATRYGLRVSKPWGDSSRYDFVVECPDGRFVRVQVKSTSHRHCGGYTCSISRGGWRIRSHYNATDIDFLALYIIPEDVWFIVPFAEVATRGSSNILLNPYNPEHRFSPFREAWHLLDPRLAPAPESPGGSTAFRAGESGSVNQGL